MVPKNTKNQCTKQHSNYKQKIQTQVEIAKIRTACRYQNQSLAIPTGGYTMPITDVVFLWILDEVLDVDL